MLALIAEHGLVNGERSGVRRLDDGGQCRAQDDRGDRRDLPGNAEADGEESGIETPSADDLVRIDRARKGKKLSNADWVSATDPDAKIAKMKDGTTHLAYKPEHAVDPDGGAVVAAEIHPADEGDTTTLSGTLQAAAAKLAKVDRAPSTTETAELVSDKGYHSRPVLKDLAGRVWKTRIAEPQRPAVMRCREAARADQPDQATFVSAENSYEPCCNPRVQERLKCWIGEQSDVVNRLKDIANILEKLFGMIPLVEPVHGKVRDGRLLILAAYIGSGSYRGLAASSMMR